MNLRYLHISHRQAVILTVQALENAMEAAGRCLQRLSPRLLRKALQLPKSGVCLRREELGLLLAYALSDAPAKGPWGDELTAQLDLVPLLRLADAEQLHDGSGDDAVPGVAMLRTAPGAYGPALWLCHLHEKRAYPALLSGLGPVFPLDTTDARFLAAAQKLVAGNLASNVLVSPQHGGTVAFLCMTGATPQTLQSRSSPPCTIDQGRCSDATTRRASVK